jgi:hypothetical protein
MHLRSDENSIYFIEATYQYYTDVESDMISDGYIGFVKGISNLYEAKMKLEKMRDNLLSGLIYNHDKRLLIGRLNEIYDYNSISNAKTTDILYFNKNKASNKLLNGDHFIDKNIVIKDILDKYFNNMQKVIFNEISRDFEIFDLLVSSE